MLKKPIALSILVFVLLAAAPLTRADTPASGTGQIDPGFLLLPAYDLQWVSPPKSVRVGDTLEARVVPGPVQGAGQGAAQGTGALLSAGMKIALPAGAENADDPPFVWSDQLASAPDGTLEIQATAVKPGQTELPALAIEDASGKAIARTNPLTLSVASAIASDDPKPKQPDPPRPPVSLAIPVVTMIFSGILLLALFAGIIYAIVRWSRRRLGALPPPAAEPPKSEDELALAKLAQLEHKGLLRTGQFKAHYFAVSEIIKHYVGARYGFDAAESTTYEMITHLEEHKGVPGAAMESLKSMFERLDRVKFTDYVPVPVEGTELLEEARKLVLSTRRPPPVVAGLESRSGAGASAAT